MNHFLKAIVQFQCKNMINKAKPCSYVNSESVISESIEEERGVKKTKTLSINKLSGKNSPEAKSRKAVMSLAMTPPHNNFNQSSEGLQIDKDTKIQNYRQLQIKELETVLKAKKENTTDNTALGFQSLINFCKCHIETIYKFKYVNKAYQNTGIYLELIRFLKLYNDVDLVKKFFFNENNYRLIEHDYSFFRNSEITVTHYTSAFKYIPFYNNNNNKKLFRISSNRNLFEVFMYKVCNIY